jgi:phosphoribosylamine--glycine ligase
MASEGYPGSYVKGRTLQGLDEAGALSNVKIFHAGTKLDAGRVVSDGGRVLGVTALGETLAAAKARAYQAAQRIDFTGAFYRRDIGDKAIQNLAAVEKSASEPGAPP